MEMRWDEKLDPSSPFIPFAATILVTYVPRYRNMPNITTPYLRILSSQP